MVFFGLAAWYPSPIDSVRRRIWSSHDRFLRNPACSVHSQSRVFAR